MRGWELVKLALGGVGRTPLRVALTALGVAIATGALVSLVAFAQGLQAQAETPFRKLDLLNTIEITSEDDDGDPAATRGTTVAPLLDDDALARMAAVPGVALAYPRLTLAGLQATCGGKSRTTFAMALPREASRLEFVKELVVSGRFFSPGGAGEVLVGKKLARALGFVTPDEALGRRITLKAMGLVPAAPLGFRFEQRKVELEVVGVWDPPGLVGLGAASEALLLPVDVIRQMPGIGVASALEQMRSGEESPREGYRRAVVRVERPADAPRVEEAIRGMGFKTSTLVTQLKELRVFFIVMDALLAAVGMIALVVAGLGIINTLLMAVLERYREIGIYKAIGASDGDVRILFLAEAGLVGLLGGGGGLLLGRGVSRLIEIGVQMYAQSKGVEQEIAVFSFPLWLMLGALLFAVGTSVLAGVYPASRASRVDPIHALRGE